MRWLENPNTLRISGALTAAGFLGMFLLLRQGSVTGTELVELQTTYSAAEFRAILSDWGADGVRAFLNHLWIDAVQPVFYSIFLASLYALSLEKEAPEPPVGPRRPIGPKTRFISPWF